jgi:transposase
LASLVSLLPHLRGLHVESIDRQPECIVLVAAAIRRSAACPACGRRSTRLHSAYRRTLADLPLGGQPVTLHLRVRRFWCHMRRCPQRIFAERFPTLTAVRARRTTVQHHALTAIGFALGGNPGSRLARRLALPTSRATLLRFVRAAPQPERPAPLVLGVDDWAMRKGRRYGTIFVDLEAHRPVDLIDDRTATALTTWLNEHSKPTVISRDRAGAYAEGARQGAPDAVQVADRFHLLCNAGDALERVLSRHHAALRRAAAAVDALHETERDDAPAPVQPPPPRTRVQHEAADRRARRLARYEEVIGLHTAGASQREIASRLGLSRKTVRRFLRSPGFPERARPRRAPSALVGHEPYLRERWAAGCHNAHTLWEELRARGFTGAPARVRSYVAPWRTRPARRGRAAQRTSPGSPPAFQPTRVWSPRRARWLLLQPQDTLREDERHYRTLLLADAPDLVRAIGCVEDFSAIVRERDEQRFQRWLVEAERGTLPELRGFAAGIRRDQAAVEAALTTPWSNGQTEGQINRLKTLKRQMYGRAKLDLLRQRFLAAA